MLGEKIKQKELLRCLGMNDWWKVSGIQYSLLIINLMLMFSERSSTSSRYQLSVSKCLSPSYKLSQTLIDYWDGGGRRPSHMSHLDEEAKSGKDLLERSWGTSSQLQGVIKLSKHEPDILQFCKYILNSGTFCYDPTYTSGDGNVGWITDGTLGPF